jgi:hypothetical protein
MFLVLTGEFQLSTTIRLGRLHLNTFEHRFRISRLLYPITPFARWPKCDLIQFDAGVLRHREMMW